VLVTIAGEVKGQDSMDVLQKVGQLGNYCGALSVKEIIISRSGLVEDR